MGSIKGWGIVIVLAAVGFAGSLKLSACAQGFLPDWGGKVLTLVLFCLYWFLLAFLYRTFLAKK